MPLTTLTFTPTSASSFRVDALEYVAENKKALHKLLPDVKSSHLAEAIAASLGFKTHAAMLAQLEGKSMTECPEFDEPRFAARLVELGYPDQVTALPDAHGRFRSGATSMVAGGGLSASASAVGSEARRIHGGAASWVNQRDEPLYPRLVSEQEIQDIIEEATSAACKVLDDLFTGQPKEARGIGNNFQGTLKDHIEAMLTGKAAATWSYRRDVPSLFGDWRSLGRLPTAGPREGYTIVKGDADDALYFDSDRSTFAPLERLGADVLFTSEEHARGAAFAWMGTQELSPRDAQCRLCILSWDDIGPLKLVAISD